MKNFKNKKKWIRKVEKKIENTYIHFLFFTHFSLTIVVQFACFTRLSHMPKLQFLVNFFLSHHSKKRLLFEKQNFYFF